MKNILYVFLWINIVAALDISAMEQPNGQQTEQLLCRVYPSNLPLLVWCAGLKNEESCLSMLPNELIEKIINHIRRIQNGQYLLNAMKVNYKDAIWRLLNEPYIDVNIKDENGYTPLIYAVVYNNPEIVQILLEKGANPNIQGRYERTALNWAVKNKRPQIVQLLLNKGASISPMEQPNAQPSRRLYTSKLPLLLLSGRLKNNESCLSMLPTKLIAEIIKHIREIQNGQDLLNARNDRDLLDAVEANDENKVKQLLSKPYIDVNVKYNFGYTALNLAVQKYNPIIVQILLDKGANPDIQDHFGDTPLIWAAIEYYPDITQMLLNKSANLDIQDNSGCTALILAVKQAHDEVAEMLLDDGANPNIPDNNGYTPLYLAVKNNSRPIIRMLLNKGANPNIQNKLGETLLKYAISNEDPVTINLIIKAKEKLDCAFANIGTSRS